MNDRTLWHSIPIAHTLERFTVAPREGLSADEIAARRLRYGNNLLAKKRDFGIAGTVARQFTSPLVLILLFAGVSTLFLEVYVDTIVIFIALAINIVIGSIQEHRASRAFEELNRSREKFATVVRSGKKLVISAQEIVPGDVIVLEAGMSVPADVRLIEHKELSVNEAMLTGEWVAVEKNSAQELVEKTPLAERATMAWMGTLVSSGSGLGVVVATGSHTEMGQIAERLQEIDDRPTPLQQNINAIAHFLLYVIFVAVALIFILGIVQGESIANMLLVSIAVAVASVPSGLPAAVTIVLALGMEAILRNGGLVRNLLAAETLGSTTIILTDKTGTLTEAKMRVFGVYSLEGITEGRADGEGDNRETLIAAISTSAAFIERKEIGAASEEELVVHGRPIEKATILKGIDEGVLQEGIFMEYPRLDFLQFESERRYALSLHRERGSTKNLLYVSGAPEYLLDLSSHVLRHDHAVHMTPEARTVFEHLQEKLSEQGFRLIAVARKESGLSEIPATEEEKSEALTGATFLGLIALSDPIRQDVADSIRVVKGAGVRVVMVTGDNSKTALYVARTAGIAQEGDRVFTGDDIDASSDKELYEKVKQVPVFARVLPEQKLRLARVLKDNGEVVAMTGDGVNDAPALQSAHIGVAVGSGTDVAKAAADIVLLNNSFSIITTAIAEGRRIIDNLKKIVSYLLSTSFSEIAVIGSALALGAPLPLLPGQILWANIVEEGFMSFSFAFEKAEPGIMERDPRNRTSHRVLSPQVKKLIAIISVVTSVFLVALYFILHAYGMPLDKIRTFMFAALSLDSIFFAFSFKNLEQPVWRTPLLSNRYLLAALSVSVALLVGALMLPPLQILLSLVPLSALEMLFLLSTGIFNLFVIEIVKYTLFGRVGGR